MPPEFFAFHGKKRRSCWRKTLMISLAVLEGFFTTLPYGWPSLVVVLKAEGFYSDLCHSNPCINDGNSTDIQNTRTFKNESTPWPLTTSSTLIISTTDDMTATVSLLNRSAANGNAITRPTSSNTASKLENSCSCPAQDEKLNLIFTIAMALTLAGCLPTGAIYDSLGPRKTRLICSFLFEAAIVMFIFADKGNPNILFPATAMLGVIGAPLLVSLFEVANTFPNWRFTLVSILNGACMMSTVVFLSFQKLHEAGISMQAQFTFLLFFTSCLFLVNTFYVVPAEKIMDVCPGETPKYYPELYGEECVRLKEHGYKGKDLMPNSNGLVQQTEHCVSDLNLFHQIPIKTYSAFMNQVEVNVCSNKKRGSFRHTICTPMFLWFVVWSAVMTFREYYFIGTLNPFLGFITNGNEADVDHYTAVFGYISLGVIFVAPLVGLVMDSKGDSPLFTAITAIMITTSHTVLYSLTVLIPLIEVQIVTFVLVTIQRGFIHGVLSSFIGMAFPQDHYGKFYGFVYLVAGLITLMQSPLFTLSQKSNNEDPFYVNIGILAFTLLAHGHPIYIWYYCDRDLKEKITEKREEKKEPLISPTTDGYI